MDEFLSAALRAMASSPYAQFVAFLIMGLAVGWLLCGPGWARTWSATLAIMGVCGAWLGAEIACLIGQADRGSASEFVAALLGAGALVIAWRRRHPHRPDGSDHIALGRINA